MNIKVTEKKEFQDLKKFYEKKNNDIDFRIGNGFDVHKFKKGGTLKLLGVNLPFNKSLIGHSDADVGIHALVDAMLGVMSAGDIGDYFPDNDPQYANADSLLFLAKSYELLQQNNLNIINIDINIIAEIPKISPYKLAIRQKLASFLKLDINQISLKANSSEKLGFIGRKEGIAAQIIINVI